MIYIVFIIIVILFINIYFYNNNEYFDNFNYIGPIHFLQKTNNANDSCLDNQGYKCVGTYPDEDNYPDESEMKYVNDITIIKIPEGIRGNEGIHGNAGSNLENTYNSIAQLSKLSSSNSDNTLKIKVDSMNIKTPRINIPNNAKICINSENTCLEKDDIKKIIAIINR